MMQFIKENKLLTFGGVVVILAAFVYFMFLSGPSEEVTVVTQDETSNVSRELIITLSNLNTIRLDDSIFKDPVFLSLSDFGVQIPLQNVGRRNPFAPL
ncbi:MAG: hypothetical protein Q8P58_03045 [Candidatus Adlerbacteria bacterium]|nr:hypothetical protein [Candidatus Adlerbacteria bacterium]